VEFQSIGSLSSAQSLTPPAAAVPVRAARWAIQPVTNVASIGLDVSRGSLPVTFCPFVFTPFPASGLHHEALPVAEHSVCCCAPYFATEKPHRRTRSTGVHPMRGTVTSASPPAARISSTKTSAAEPFGRFAGFADPA